MTKKEIKKALLELASDIDCNRFIGEEIERIVEEIDMNLCNSEKNI